MATHFAIVLGAWRLRVRIDIDEPREAELRESDAGPESLGGDASAMYPQVAARGRG